MIANFPLLVNASAANSTASVVPLGSGADLNPSLKRWGVIGGLIGFGLWALATPPWAPLHAFLHQRGPTQVFCLIAAGMVATFLINKAQLLRLQRQRLEPLSRDLPGLSASGDLATLGLRAEQSSSLLGKRLLRLLTVWQTTRSSFQLERSVDADADLYELARINSYSLVKVLLWAIPILGFIGTVIGMSQAVGSFDAVLSNADNVDGLKAGLTKVTTGLGTAFDTTYLALVIAVLLTIPITAIERQEEQLLNRIDADLRTVVMALSLQEEGAMQHPAGLLHDREASSFGALISEAFEQHLPDPSVLVTPAQRYAEQLTDAALSKLTPLTTLVRDSVEGVAEARLSLQEQAHVIRNSMDGAAAELNAAVRALGPVLQQLNNASTLSTVLGEDLNQLKATIELRRAIEQLNVNLEHLERLPEQPKRFASWWRKRS